MKIEIVTLDRSFEYLTDLLGTPTSEYVINEKDGEKIDVFTAFAVWICQLRYNIALHKRDGTDAFRYAPWRSWRAIPSLNLYSVAEKMAAVHRRRHGFVPDYSRRDYQDISNWNYRRIFGQKVIPCVVDCVELWDAVLRTFPEFILSKEELSFFGELIPVILKFERLVDEL